MKHGQLILIDKSALSKYNNNYKFILTVIGYIHKTCMGYSIEE